MSKWICKCRNQWKNEVVNHQLKKMKRWMSKWVKNKWTNECWNNYINEPLLETIWPNQEIHEREI